MQNKKHGNATSQAIATQAIIYKSSQGQVNGEGP